MLTEAPKVDLSALDGREIRVRAGERLKIDVPISGAPTPTVAWKKDGKDLPDVSRVRYLLGVLQLTVSFQSMLKYVVYCINKIIV